MTITKTRLQEMILHEVKSILKEQQLALPEIGDTGRKIVSYYEVWDEEALEAGDTDDRGEEDEHEIELDEYDREEGKTVADLAVEYLSNQGVTEPSSSHFHKGVWYSSYDDDMYTGDHKVVSYHLEGFTEEEEKEVWDQMTKGHSFYR